MDANQFLSGAAEGVIDRSSIRDDGNIKSMHRTAAMFNALTGNELSERDGWLFLATVKLCRSQQGQFHSDDYIDACAYIALAGEAAHREVYPVRNRPIDISDVEEGVETKGQGQPPMGMRGMP